MAGGILKHEGKISFLPQWQLGENVDECSCQPDRTGWGGFVREAVWGWV